MSTSLTSYSGNDNPFLAAGAGVSDNIYMKFNGNTGDFLYGETDEEMPLGTEFIAGVAQSMWRWTFWWEGKPMESVEEFLINDPMLNKKEPDYLPEGYDDDMSLAEIRARQADRNNNNNDGWSLQATLPIRAADGEFTEYTLRLNSKGAVRTFQGLVTSYGKQARFRPDSSPVIVIGHSSYQIKGVGKKYSPTFKIADWISEDDLAARMGQSAEDYDAPEDEAPAALPAPEGDEAPAEAPAAEETVKPRPRGRRTRGSYES